MLFGKNKWKECKLYCSDRTQKVTEGTDKNSFYYESVFYFIEPEQMRQRTWTELTENIQYEEGKTYLGRYNPKTGEVIIDEECNI